ncbi:MAG: hypothetical protein AAFO07_05995, partial [Bacteroidota bacterium]
MKQYFYSFSLLALLALLIPFVVNNNTTTSISQSALLMTGCDNGRIFVDANAGGTEDGETWGNAYTKLQDALDEACTCGNPVEIWVAQGTYYPDEGVGQQANSRDATFTLCNNVALYGGFSGAGTETLLSERDFVNNVTTLSGDVDREFGVNFEDEAFDPDVDTDANNLTSTRADHIRGSNALHVVTGSGTDNTAVLDGFSITAGNAILSNLDNGGGMLIIDGAPTISNCVFFGNNAFFDGGGVAGENASPIVSNCTFLGNSAGTFGGGFYNEAGGTPMVSGGTFENNEAFLGGGMATNSSEPTVSNTLFTKNDVGQSGGGLYIGEDSDLTITGSQFIENTTEVQGGGLCNFDSDMTVDDCTFTDNTSFGGGGINTVVSQFAPMGVSAFAKITNSTFTRNIARSGNGNSGVGGGINVAAFEPDVAPSNAEILNCDFIENEAVFGGAISKIRVQSTTKTMDCTINSNTAEFGGGIYIDNSETTVADNTFSGNAATRDGGGMFITSDNNSSILRCAFTENTAEEGGGIHNNSANPTLTELGFFGNMASISGGGIFNRDSDPSITLNVFEDNRAPEGAGMFNESSSPSVLRSLFLFNTATTFGGGMSNTMSSGPEITECEFNGNMAEDGAGISNNRSEPIISKSSFINNDANTNGGGIYNERSSPEIINSSFKGNQATNGAGIYNDGFSRPQSTNLVVTGNSASENGGGMYNLSSSQGITNCTFSGNAAGIDGGGIYNGPATFPFIFNVIIWNNQANGNSGSTSASMFNGTNASALVSNSIIENSRDVNDIWQGALGIDQAGNKDIDPQFIQDVDPTNAPTTEGNVRLQITSPAINMGTNTADLNANSVGDKTIADVAEDNGCSPRILQTTVDIGAFEKPGCPTGLSDQIVYVNQAVATPGDGSSWDNAFNHLQDALVLACECSEITQVWVAQGTYFPDLGGIYDNNDRSSTFDLCNNVALYGGFDGTESMLSERDFENNVTILSGDIDGDDDAFEPEVDSDSNTGTLSQTDHINGNNAYHVVTGSGTDNTALIDGFTITAGNADGSSLNDSGAGMRTINGSPTIINSVFSGNTAGSSGGGMLNANGSSPTIINSVFSGNTADADGGGMRNFVNSSPTIINSVFSGNTANSGGGGGLSNQSNSSPTIVNSIFSGNTTIFTGGGMLNFNGSSPTIINSVFSGNTALSDGGGMFNVGSASPQISNTIIWNNQENGSTTAIGASIDNFDTGSIPEISNSIIANSGGSGSWNTALGQDDDENKDVNPDFIDPIDPINAPTNDGDFRLSIGSMAIDMGDNSVVTSPPFLENDQNVIIDLAGNARILDGTVDIGAYEGGTLPCDETPAEAGENQTLCGVTSTTLSATARDEGLGTWTEISGDGQGVFDDENDPVSSFEGTAGVAYTLRWTVTDGDCPVLMDDVGITFIDEPEVTGSDITRCDGDEVFLFGQISIDYDEVENGIEELTTTFYDSEANALAGGATGVISDQQTVSTTNNTFWVRVEASVNNVTCFDVDDINVTVIPAPQGEIALDFGTICDMEADTLRLNLTEGRYPVEIVVEGLNDDNPITFADADAKYVIEMDEYVLGENTYTLKSITDNVGGDNECTTSDIDQVVTLLVELPTIIDAAAATYYIQSCEDETDFLYSILITEKCRTSLADADEVEIAGPAAIVNALVSQTETNVSGESFNVEFNFEGVEAGTYSVTFTYEKSKAGRFSATTTITVEAAPTPNTEDLSCNDDVFVTLDENCSSEVTADMVLDGDNICNDLFTVVVDYGMGMKTVNEITECGQFKYEVYINNGASPDSGDDTGPTPPDMGIAPDVSEDSPEFVCWGYITGEDKDAPKYEETQGPFEATITCTDIDSLA